MNRPDLVAEPQARYVGAPEDVDAGEVSTFALMRDTAAACDWLAGQAASGSTAWANMCESLARQARGIPAHYSSAELHAKAIPAENRHGQDEPCRGDIVLYLNGGFGHIATCDPQPGAPWAAWSNDYGGRGKVSLVRDLRSMVAWCGAREWFVADAWWSPSTYDLTHTSSTPAPDDPVPTTYGEAEHMIVKVTLDGKSTFWLLSGARLTSIPSGDAAKSNLPVLPVTDRTTWDRMRTGYAVNNKP